MKLFVEYQREYYGDAKGWRAKRFAIRGAVGAVRMIAVLAERGVVGRNGRGPLFGGRKTPAGNGDRFMGDEFRDRKLHEIESVNI